MQASVQPVHVLMITEGTYPYSSGGVSNWCDMLIRALPDVDFSLISIVGDPPLKPLFTLPANVHSVQPIALWGVREALEVHSGLSVWEMRRRRASTTERVLGRDFEPALWNLLAAVFAGSTSPELGLTIRKLHRFFLAYDLDTAFRSRTAWQCFLRAAQRFFPAAAARRLHRCHVHAWRPHGRHGVALPVADAAGRVFAGRLHRADFVCRAVQPVGHRG